MSSFAPSKTQVESFEGVGTMSRVSTLEPKIREIRWEGPMCNTVTSRDKQTMATELVLSTDLFEDPVFENSRLKE